MSPTNERDAGFCSGSSENEEDLEHHHQIRLINNSSECSNSSSSHGAQSAVSEDSADKFVLPTTPVTPLTSATTTKNKRKSSEPTRVVPELTQCGPIKKRIKLENEKMLAKVQAEQLLKLSSCPQVTASPLLSPDPFRPWASLLEANKVGISGEFHLNPAHTFKRHPGVTTLHRVPNEPELGQVTLPKFIQPEQDEPIALVAKKSTVETTPVKAQQSPQKPISGLNLYLKHPDSLLDQSRIARTPSLIDETSSTASSFISPASVTLNLSTKGRQSEGSSRGSDGDQQQSKKKDNGKDGSNNAQRNYKNMTRERRIEANARERTRVHTISAAFEKLRHSVPAYSNTQKLSKLSVLRIACSYIMSLSRIAGMDYSEDQSEPPIGECVDALTKTIQTEGKLRKKKDE